MEFYNLAQEYKQQEDYDNYCISITKSANAGCRLAIETIYNDSTYTKQDHHKTLEFYEESSKEKSASYSIHYLAYMYTNGFNVVQDYQKAKA